MAAKLNSDFFRLVPEGATHCIVEERFHRGQPCWTATAVIPHGAAVPLNVYYSEAMASDVAEAVNEFLKGA